MKWKKRLTAFFVVFCLLILAVFIKAYFDGKFQSVDSLRLYVKGFGIFAPFVLIVIQAMQVVIPILPGFLGCGVGAVLFGCLGGFWCNYIGITLGSIIAFLLGKHYGTPIVKNLFPEDKYMKYSEWAGKSKSYTLLLIAGFVLPLFPDDFFCYFSGITKMTLRKFAIVAILGKPWCILGYSIFFGTMG